MTDAVSPPGPEPSGLAPPAETVGATLARAREARGLSLEEVAQQIKFAPRQIEALERDDFDALPGAAIVRGMVRSYARLLAIDAEQLLATLGDALRAPDAARLAARFQEPVPFSDGARRTNAVYAVLTAMVLVVAAAVFFEWRFDTGAGVRMTFVSPQRAAPAGERLAVANAASVPGTLATGVTGRVKAPPEPAVALVSEPGTGAGPATAQTVATAAVTAVAVERPAKAPVAAGAHRVEFEFSGPSWVEIRDARGVLLLSRLNPAGSEASVEGTPPFALVIGNARFVRLRYDGASVDLQPHIRVEVARFSLP